MKTCKCVLPPKPSRFKGTRRIPSRCVSPESKCDLVWFKQLKYTWLSASRAQMMTLICTPNSLGVNLPARPRESLIKTIYLPRCTHARTHAARTHGPQCWRADAAWRRSASRWRFSALRPLQRSDGTVSVEMNGLVLMNAGFSLLFSLKRS